LNHPIQLIQVLESYLKTQEGNGAHDTGAPVTDLVEVGEIELYRASILHEAGKHEAAIALLKDRASRISDRLGSMELQANIQLALGNLAEAANLFRRLINSIPDNYDYHRCLPIVHRYAFLRLLRHFLVLFVWRGALCGDDTLGFAAIVSRTGERRGSYNNVDSPFDW
jgi:tetratricopeptide (TPR) repeat protein